MISRSTQDELVCVVKPVGAEDLRVGEYFAVLSEVREYPSFFWCIDPQIRPREEPVRIEWRTVACGTPWRIKAICLPFVFAKHPLDQLQSFDLRHVRVAKLDPDYARLVSDALRKQQRKSAKQAGG